MFEDLIPDLQPFARALVDACGAAGLQPRVTSTVRSRSQQEKLYSDYLAGRRAYPAARPGSSAHEFGYAFDMVLDAQGQYRGTYEGLIDAGQLWQSWGGIWGAKNDPVHFEYPGFRPPEIVAPEASQVPWYVNLTAGLPFTLPETILLDLFGIPSAARKDVTPEQLAYLRSLVR